MKIREGRGQYKVRQGVKNLSSIIKYYEEFPDATMTSCARHLGLSLQTVSKHVKAINKS